LRLNLRNHRKLLIVDGRLGFTGGMNISSRHMLDSDSPDRVEDVHFRVTGPVVAEMQHAFVEDWLLATDESLGGAAYFPTLAGAGPALCRGIISGPDEDFEKIHWIMLAALAAAQSSVHIATPYFVPTHALLAALSMAALRGVEVTLFLPAKTDLPYMRWVADAYLWQLLEHGVRVYRRIGPFVHSKLLAVDRCWVLVGSANLDPRSFRLNFEFNVEAYDPRLASQLCGWLDGQIPDCEPVTLQAVDARSMPRRFRDGLVKLLSPHL
jgi:cardiolipin synthase